MLRCVLWARTPKHTHARTHKRAHSDFLSISRPTIHFRSGPSRPGNRSRVKTRRRFPVSRSFGCTHAYTGPSRLVFRRPISSSVAIVYRDRGFARPGVARNRNESRAGPEKPFGRRTAARSRDAGKRSRRRRRVGDNAIEIGYTVRRSPIESSECVRDTAAATAGRSTCYGGLDCARRYVTRINNYLLYTGPFSSRLFFIIVVIIVIVIVYYKLFFVLPYLSPAHNTTLFSRPGSFDLRSLSGGIRRALNNVFSLRRRNI